MSPLPRQRNLTSSLRRFSVQQVTALLLTLTFLPGSFAQEQLSPETNPLDSTMEAGGANCTFKAQPDEYLSREASVRELMFERSASFKAGRYTQAAPTVDPSSIPPVNFIDNEIFGKMAAQGVPSARLTTDEEFVRRIYLDLTGRIPAPEQTRAFLADTNENKRKELIDRLLYSREFTDKWTMWWGDLLQNTATNSFRSSQNGGRNAMYGWIAAAVSENRSMKDMVFEILTAKGNTFMEGTPQGAATWVARWQTPGGPIEDTYDNLFSRSAAQFLGMGHYDCIICHDGRGHLEQLSLWGRRATRLEAYQMSSFFSRIRYFNRRGDLPMSDFPNSTDVSDASTGNYNMNTTFGNRPRRVAIGTIRNTNPAYRSGPDVPASADWRAVYAANLVNDRMFARNFANRLWKATFNMALVEPVDQLDPSRLDPKNPPTLGDWKLQASHPELLERLADDLIDSNFNLREFMRKLVESSAYQLSSDYDDSWNIERVPLFARHFPRRMEGEEIHDAMQAATAVMGRYTIPGWADPVSWAMQLPEPREPNSNGGVRDFLNLFLRGNRDNQFRSQDGSVLQQMNLMNNTFVTSRAKVANSTVLRAIATMTSTDAMSEELWMRFLSRRPTATEKAKAMAFLARAGTVQTAKNLAVEDMAWVLMNKQEFIFSY
jgi:hypothetical protein